MSYLSRVKYTGTGSTTLYSIPFAYISKAYVQVRIGGVLQADGVGYSWASPTTISLASALPTGVILDIRRSTPSTTKLVDFQDGSVLTEAALDLSADQVFHLVTESLDNVADSFLVTPTGEWDARNMRVINAENPIDPQDLVTKAHGDATYGGAGVERAEQAAIDAQAAAVTAATVSATASADAATAIIAAANAQAAVGGVKVTTTDTLSSPLNTKLAVSGSLTKTVSSVSGVQTLTLGVNVPVTSVMGRTGAVVLTSPDVTGALGFTPIATGGRAYPLRSDGGAMNFIWSGQAGQPTWCWGGSDGSNMYVYNPANFSVAYAGSAGFANNCDYLGGNHYTTVMSALSAISYIGGSTVGGSYYAHCIRVTRLNGSWFDMNTNPFTS